MTNSKGILALDLDGVVADTWVGNVYHTNNIPSPMTEFIESVPHTKHRVMQSLGRHDVEGVVPSSVMLISDLIHNYPLDVVVVSSWVHGPDTYKEVFQVFQHVFPQLQEHQWVGQTSGCGGNREHSFFRFIRENYERDDVKRVIAIDDSGVRHFPTMVANTVACCGRNGFIVDDYIEATQILEYDEDGGWRRWADQYKQMIPPEDPQELWNRIFDETDTD